MEMQSTHRRRWRGLVLEGIAVLIGVLLAFTVDSLAEARAERQVEQAYLVALADEVGSNTVLLKNLVATTRDRISEVDRYMEEVVHALPASTIGESEVNQMLFDIGPFRVATFQSGALDDLLTSGGMELVRSEDVRRSILFYAQLLSQEVVRQEASLDFWEDHMSPYYYAHASFFNFMEDMEWRGVPLPGGLDVAAFHRSTLYSNLLIERQVRDLSLLRTRDVLSEQMQALAAVLPGG